MVILFKHIFVYKRNYIGNYKKYGRNVISKNVKFVTMENENLPSLDLDPSINVLNGIPISKILCIHCNTYLPEEISRTKLEPHGVFVYS